MNNVLRQIEDILEGYNYTVFLRTYAVTHPADVDTVTIITSALGSGVVIGNIVSETRDELLAEVESSITHAGDDAYGPKPERLASPELAELLRQVRSQVTSLCDSTSGLFTFWLKDGHPAYPVYWDFAFLFRGTSESTVFIGSSSD
jgi:hypothetical protein